MGPGDGAACDPQARIEVTPATDCLQVEDGRGEPECDLLFALFVRNRCASELILSSPRPGWAARVGPGADQPFELDGPSADIDATLDGTPIVIRYRAP